MISLRKREGTQTHDYTVRGWGHDYTFHPVDRGGRASMMGWGYGITAGDYLLLPDGPGRNTRYLVTQIDYYRDPSDMWKARVVFAPRIPDGADIERVAWPIHD